MPHKIYLADALYVPSRMATPAIREGMIFRHFQEQACKTAGPNRSHCPERPSRPTEVCMQCPAFTIYNFVDDGDVDGVPYTSLALGGLQEAAENSAQPTGRSSRKRENDQSDHL